jgi:GPI mannosyltransferase 3
LEDIVGVGQGEHTDDSSDGQGVLAPLRSSSAELPESWSIALITIAFVPRLWAALGDHGMVWPDEIFSMMEPAHRFAFGWGLLPWEFVDGARSWLLPGMLGLGWKLAAVLGAKTALSLVNLAKGVMATASVIAVLISMRLASRLGGARAAFLTGAFGALCPPLIIFGSRCLSETVSAPVVVLVALLLIERGRRRAAMAGALAALTIYFRYQNGLLAAGFGALLLSRKRWREAGAYFACATTVGLLGGLLDWPTWGYPFRAFWVYTKFCLLEGKAAYFGTSPYSFLWDHLGTTIGLVAPILFFGFLAATRKAPGLVVVVLVFFLAHSAIPHKELRFLLPVLPLGLALSAVGLSDLFTVLAKGGYAFFASPWCTLAFSLATMAQMGFKLRAPTYVDIGYDGDDPVWHRNEDYFTASMLAAEARELCGIIYTDLDAASTGGYTYLHRPVPILLNAGDGELASANYLVGARDHTLPKEWIRVYGSDKYALWKRPGTCSPPPAGWTQELWPDYRP